MKICSPIARLVVAASVLTGMAGCPGPQAERASDPSDESQGTATEEVVLRGRVVDADGRPVVGATARYVPDPDTIRQMGFGVPVEEDYFVVNFGGLSLSALPTVLTDDDGRFEILATRVLGKPEDQFNWHYWNRAGVLITKEGYATTVPGFFFYDPPMHDFGDIKLTSELKVTGRIVDEDGAALSGAIVRLDHLSPWYERRRMHDAGTILRIDGLDRAVADETGRFVFGGLEAGGAFFTVGFDGHATAILTIAGANGEVADTGTIVLPAARSIGGTIVDEQGKPVEGGDVWLADANFDRRRMPGGLMGPPRWYKEGYDWSNDQIAALQEYRVPHAASGESGEFEVQGRGSPSYDLYAYAPGYRLHRIEDLATGEDNLTVTLLPEAPGAAAPDQDQDPADAKTKLHSVVVSVHDKSGEPVANAQILFVPYQGSAGDLQGRTGPDGSLRFELAAAGPAVVYAVASEVGVSDRVRIAQSELATGARVELSLRPTGQIRGTVLAEDGGVAPFGWVDIESIDQGDPWLRPHSRDVRADAEGRFRITSLPVGRYRVNTAYRHQGRSGTDVTVEPGSTAEVSVQPRKETPRITGRVSSGEVPVPGADIRGPRQGEPFVYFGAWTDTDGVFDGWAEEPGEYELTVETQDGGRAGPKMVSVTERGVSHVDFALPTGSIDGRVVSAKSEEGVGGAFVMLVSSAGTTSANDFTDADGLFSFRYQNDGTYTVFVVRRIHGFDHAGISIALSEHEITVRDGKPVRPVIRVTGGESIEGTVRLPSGVGARDGTEVRLVQMEPKPKPHPLNKKYTAATYSWQGRYQFRGLLPGTYRVMAEAESDEEVREGGAIVEVGQGSAGGVDLVVEKPGPRPLWAGP
jgi:protocatechuate 3,4-dioxygenase beta subunit